MVTFDDLSPLSSMQLDITLHVFPSFLVNSIPRFLNKMIKYFAFVWFYNLFFFFSLLFIHALTCMCTHDAWYFFLVYHTFTQVSIWYGQCSNCWSILWQIKLVYHSWENIMTHQTCCHAETSKDLNGSMWEMVDLFWKVTASANSRTSQEMDPCAPTTGSFDAKSTYSFICGERLALCKVAKHWLCVCV